MHSSESLLTTIVIADDHPVFRYGLRRLLETEPDFRIVGEAIDGDSAVRLTRELQPHILLLDLAMPGVSGMEALGTLLQQNAEVRTIILTAEIEKGEVTQALQLGARGIVLKQSATELIAKCIRRVLEGQVWVGRDCVGDMIDVLRTVLPQNGLAAPRRDFSLTPRETQVLTAILAGFGNKELAARLSISEQTAKHHISNIYDKLGVSNRMELALFAINHRLVDKI